VRQAVRSFSVAAFAALLILAPFLFGYVVGHRDGTGRPQTAIESLLAETHLIDPADEAPPAASRSPELDQTFKPFWEAWDRVTDEYYDGSVVAPERLAHGALRGMISSLGDPNSVYLDPTHREMTEAELRGTFDGIGVNVEIMDERLRVVSPLEGSPGGRAGLQPGDVITHVDGRDITGMNLSESIRLIRGPRGSTVTLTVSREDRAPFDVALQREEIRVQAVRGEIRADGVAQIRITSFSLRVGNEIRQTVERLAERNPSGWVLDMRGNPGGYLDGAVAVASQFIDNGVVLYEQRRNGEREEVRTRGRSRAVSGPMVILVDKGTASAAEIVAAALRDNGRARLIGEQTFGKGSVQAVHRLSDGSALRLTVARWLTPTGEPIQGVGLTPDIAVVTTAGVDTVLDEAVNYVRQQSASATGSGPTALRPGETPESLESAAAPADDDAAAVGILDSVERATVGQFGLL
jgi:carboxyl-terminal processing protease